jgi:CRP-like cAMP-binding protein
LVVLDLAAKLDRLFHGERNLWMSTDVTTLKEIDFFAEIELPDLQQVADRLHPMSVVEGEVLTRRGDLAHTFFIVLEGQFMIYFKQGRALTLHHRGEVIGWSTMVSPFTYTGTAVALTDAMVLSAPGDEMLRLIQANAALGEKIMAKVRAIAAQRMPYATGAPESPHP